MGLDGILWWFSGDSVSGWFRWVLAVYSRLLIGLSCLFFCAMRFVGCLWSSIPKNGKRRIFLVKSPRQISKLSEGSTNHGASDVAELVTPKTMERSTIV